MPLFTPPYTPQHTRVADPTNRTILEIARCMINYPLCMFCPESASTAVYLPNPSQNSANQRFTPFQILNKRKPYVKHLKTFGCHAYVILEKFNRPSKMSNSSFKCIFVAYDNNTTCYRLFNIITTNKFFFLLHTASPSFIEKKSFWLR